MNTQKMCLNWIKNIPRKRWFEIMMYKPLHTSLDTRLKWCMCLKLIHKALQHFLMNSDMWKGATFDLVIDYDFAVVDYDLQHLGKFWNFKTRIRLLPCCNWLRPCQNCNMRFSMARFHAVSSIMMVEAFRWRGRWIYDHIKVV